MKAYLDCGTTTSVAPEVLEAMLPYLTEKFGHPLSFYSVGQEAADAVEGAKETVAKTINAREEEIVFTSGATEANDIALRGVAYANRKRGNHIITTRVENPSILRVCERLEKEGFRVDYLPVDREGFVDLGELERALTDETILVSIANVNDEIGTIQPMKEVREILEGRDVYLHVNAAAAYGRLRVDVEEMGADLLSLSAHKIHGPKGIGALYVRKGSEIEPLSYGYISLFPLRPGTENVAGIVGFAKAAELASEKLEEHRLHMRRLRDLLMEGIERSIPHVVLHGPRGERRSLSNVNYSFKGVVGEAILLRLDLEGIAVAIRSACATRKLEPSHVLAAIGVKPEVAHGSIRFTFTWRTKMEEIEYTLEVLPRVIEGLRKMSPVKPEEV